MREAKFDGLARWTLLTHFQGRIPDVTLACIHYLRKQFPSIRVSVEAEKPGRPGLQELADAADMVFFSKSWAQVSFTLGLARVCDTLTDGLDRARDTDQWRNVW